jgi:CHASE1-domain containing sensor protein
MKMPLSSNLLAFSGKLAGFSVFVLLSGYFCLGDAIAHETEQVAFEQVETAQAETVQTEIAQDGTMPNAVQTFHDVRSEELAEATEAFLASLDETQRAAAVLPFDHPFRTRAFCYVLARCNTEFVGLRMMDLNAT